MRAWWRSRAGAESSLAQYVGGDLGRITAQTVYQAAHDGDELAMDVVNDTAKLLGIGIANLLNIFNPEVVVVCGGVTLAGDHLFTPLRGRWPAAPSAAVEVCRIVPCADRHSGSVRSRKGVPGFSRLAALDAENRIVGSLVWDLIYGRDPLSPVE